jgi:hypothetical protein
MYDKIINPLTGRKISIFSKKGNEILKNFINQSGGDIKLDGWIGNLDNPLNECDAIVSTNWWGKKGGKHPIQIGDEFKIIFGLRFVNYKKERFTPNLLTRMLGGDNVHAWLEVTSSKTKCKYTFGLSGGGGDRFHPGQERVSISSPDLIIRKCRRRAKECIDAQLQGYDYEIDGKNRGKLNINSGEEGGCRYVCSGITSINSHDDEFNKYYPNFMEVKKGKIRHVHLRIIDWLMNNSKNTRKDAIVYFNNLLLLLTKNRKNFTDLNIDLDSLWNKNSNGNKILLGKIKRFEAYLKNRNFNVNEQDRKKIIDHKLDEAYYYYSTITDVHSTSVMSEIPFKYLKTANVLGLGAILDFTNWLNGEEDALASCQSFASDFHSNPTYIFNKLYPGVYDERVENEKTALEKNIAKLRWKKLKNKLKIAVQIQKHQNKIDIHEDDLKEEKKLLEDAISPGGRRIRNRNIKKEKDQIKEITFKINKIQSKIDKIKHFDEAVNPEMIENLLEERKVLNDIWE